MGSEIHATIQFIKLHVLGYKTDTFPFILCGCEIFSLTSREEQILVFLEQVGEWNIWCGSKEQRD
jgi:hypothetical protein